MTRFGVRLAAAAFLVLACDRTARTTPTTVTPAEAAETSSPVEASFVEGTGQAGSEDEAHVLALLELATVLLGDPAWLDVVPLEIHDRGRDVFRREADADGAIRVTVGLSRARAAAVLAALTETELRLEGPSVWRETLHPFFLAHVARLACERRRALFGAACEDVDTAEVDAALAALGSKLTLTSSYTGGVPLDAEQRPLRDPGAYVLWRGLPTADVPLVARWPSEGERVLAFGRSDARGHATFEPPAAGPWSGDVAISVDTRALLGPLRDRLPEIAVSIPARPVDLQRWGALVIEAAGDAAPGSGPVLVGLRERLKQSGLPDATRIPENRAKALARSAPEARPGELGPLAEALGGRLDVLLVLEVESRYTSRMGGARVWYEARGRLDAFEVWSGRKLTTLETAASASGLGNERADEAARRALGRELATLVLQDPAIPKPKTLRPLAVSQR